MSSCEMSSSPNTIRSTFSRVVLMIDSWMHEIQTPARKPPRWPQQSMLESPEEGVKMKMKTMMRRAWHQIWHFIAEPTRSRPFQLMTMQPMMTPMMPKSAVEAPALTPWGEQRRLKMLPLIPVMRQTARVFKKPKVYSILERNMKVVIRLPKMCMKYTCRNIAEISRYTCPDNTLGWQFPPYEISVSAFTFNRQLEDLSSPTDTSKMKSAMSARLMRKVRERNLKVGQRANFSMSQQFSSWGFLTWLRPEMKSILFSSAILSCSARTGSEKPSKKPPLSLSSGGGAPFLLIGGTFLRLLLLGLGPPNPWMLLIF